MTKVNKMMNKEFLILNAKFKMTKSSNDITIKTLQHEISQKNDTLLKYEKEN